MGKGKGVQGFDDDGIGLPARFASLFNVAAIGLYVTRVLGGCATLRSTLSLIAYRSLCPSFLFFKFPHLSLSFLSFCMSVSASNIAYTAMVESNTAMSTHGGYLRCHSTAILMGFFPHVDV